MVHNKDELIDFLIASCGYDTGDVLDYLRYYSVDIDYPMTNDDAIKIEEKLRNWLGIEINESTVDKLKEVYAVFEKTSLGEYYVDEFDDYKAALKCMHDLKQEDMSKKLLIKRIVRNRGAMKESTELNEGWSSYYGWTSPADVKEALKETEISSLWEYVKNFGNFFCYKRKSDGRPLVCYYLIKKLCNEWGYKDIGLDSSLKYNASVAAWLKKELNEFGSTEENPGDFTEYWNWITNGKKEQDEKINWKQELHKGDKVEMKYGTIVTVENPVYNNQAFSGYADDEPGHIYKWYYRDIKNKVSKDVSVTENTTFREFINESGFVDYIDETDTQTINESIEDNTPDDGISDGETYDQWKLNVFKYLDKRIDVNKVKELGTYIKDYIKQEFDAGEPSWFVVAESVVNYARMKYPEVLKNRESNAFNITEGAFNKATQKIWVITFDSEDEANEQYYLFANEGGWDSVFEITQKDNKIYVMDSINAAKIVNEWFGDKAELVRLNPEEYNDIFNLDESVKSVKPDEFVGIVEFYTEDGAYDAIGAWDKMKNPSIKPMPAFDPDTIINMKEYNTYKSVDAEKLENEIQITAPTKKLLLMAMNWLTEVDEDAVCGRTVVNKV